LFYVYCRVNRALFYPDRCHNAGVAPKMSLVILTLSYLLQRCFPYCDFSMQVHCTLPPPPTTSFPSCYIHMPSVTSLLFTLLSIFSGSSHIATKGKTFSFSPTNISLTFAVH
jgi:hypothetical protein